MSRFLSKTKPLDQAITSTSSEQDCDNCRASGKILCITCQGKGFVKKLITEQIKCDACAGIGKLSVPCLACAGTGSTSKKLRFEDKGGQGVLHQEGILYNAKRTETVSVLVKNSDEVVGRYQVSVTLKDGKNTNAKGALTLKPGETAPVALSFSVSDKDGYPASYEIIPDQLQIPCVTCTSKGMIEKTCAACQGTGEAPSQRQASEICSVCSGAGEKSCSKCSGSGRVRA